MMVKCPRCGYSWDYNGISYKGLCTRCGTSVAAKRGHQRYLESIAEIETAETGEAA